MAGETVKSEAICLSIIPWSKTSHVVAWLTPKGKVTTVVKGAVRPKSAFLGQYDLNYTCEIVYYARAKGELHALRECTPIKLREDLRADFRALAFLSYARALVERLAPQGIECEDWYRLLTETFNGPFTVASLVRMELKILSLMGLEPDIECDGELYKLRGEREIPVSKRVVAFLRTGMLQGDDENTPLDAARVIGVFYLFHVEIPQDVRRTALGIITRT